MMGGIKRFYRPLATLLAILIMAPLPWFSIGVFSVIGLSVKENIPLGYWVLYGAFVCLCLVAFLIVRKRYPDKIPRMLRAKQNKNI